MGNGISKIEGGTFSGCSSLKSIDIPSSITSIGENAFSYCGLERLTIPDNVVSIGDGAFAGCGNLRNVNISNNLTYISDEAFVRCPLSEVNIGNSVKVIGEFSFAADYRSGDNTNAALTQLTIPGSVTEIQYKAFYNNINLSNIIFSGNIEKINSYAFENTAWYNNQPDGLIYVDKAVLTYKGKVTDGNIVIKDGIKGIGETAFQHKDITSITLPEGLTYIGQGAFYDTKINEITIPATVTEIGQYAIGYGGTNSFNSNWNEYYNKYCYSLDRYETKNDSLIIYGKSGTAAEKYANENGFKFVPKSTGTVSTTGVYCFKTYPSIVAGLVTTQSDPSDISEYRWLAYDEGQAQWIEVSPWTRGNEWLNWTPNKSGNYIILAQARVVGNEDSLINSSFGTPYNKYIKANCQMPYWGEGGGYLIGFESYDNPNQEYQYEMFVMDLSLYASGSATPWVYRTGAIKLSEGKTLWTIWQPQYGYYLTLFRLYDKNGNTIDEMCYGFANAY